MICNYISWIIQCFFWHEQLININSPNFICFSSSSMSNLVMWGMRRKLSGTPTPTCISTRMHVPSLHSVYTLFDNGFIHNANNIKLILCQGNFGCHLTDQLMYLPFETLKADSSWRVGVGVGGGRASRAFHQILCSLAMPCCCFCRSFLNVVLLLQLKDTWYQYHGENMNIRRYLHKPWEKIFEQPRSVDVSQVDNTLKLCW